MVGRELILTKVFTELRFTASLLYSDLKLLNIFINYLKETFDDVQYNSNASQISCVSENNNIQGYFWNNRIVVDMINPNYNDFKNTTEGLLLKYCETFDINRFDRAGIRFHWVDPFENIEAAKELFYEKLLPFLKNTKAPVDIGTVNSAKCELNLSIGGNKRLNLAIQPTKVQTVDVTIGPSGAQHIVVNTEGIMLDSDLYEEGKLNTDDYLSLLKIADNETRKKALILYDIIGLQKR